MGVYLKFTIGVVLHCVLSFKYAVKAESVNAEDNLVNWFYVIPAELVQVTYPNDLEVTPGIELSPLQVTTPPIKVKWDADPSCYYTLAMVDIDVPVQPQALHWLITNIRGNDVKNGDLIASYLSPVPAAGLYPHSYVFVVYWQEQGKISIEDSIFASFDNQIGTRINFDVQEFADNLGLGDPLAINYFNVAIIDAIGTPVGL